MVKQYPYALWVQQADEAVQDENGHYSGASALWVNRARCRDESNIQNQTVALADSTYYPYEYLILLPKGTPPVTAGTNLEVRDGATVRLTGTCKRFSTDQLHCRLWV